MDLVQILLLSLLFIVGFVSLYYYSYDHHLHPTIRNFFSWIPPNQSSPAWRHLKGSSDKIDNHTAAVRKNNNNIHEHDKDSTITTGSSSSSTTAGDGNSKRVGHEEVKRVFQTFDENGDGFITRNELRDMLMKMGMSTSNDEVGRMVERLDSSGDGLIDLDEFSRLFFDGLPWSSGDARGICTDGKNSFNESVVSGGGLKEAFEVFDRDGDGLISVNELGLVLSSIGMNEGKREEVCREMIKKVDLDGDGMVSFQEFKMMMMTGSDHLFNL